MAKLWAGARNYQGPLVKACCDRGPFVFLARGMVFSPQLAVVLVLLATFAAATSTIPIPTLA